MNMNTTRIDDKFNVVALATIVAIVISIGSTLVDVEVDTGASAAALASTPAQAVASTLLVAAR